MPRYRTIKPEFWADDNMLDLSDSCALFYISLWNFCDDEGKIENKPRAISKSTCRWSEGKVKLFIKTLVTCGRLRISMCSTWLQVENWQHQKIDRPKDPKILASEIQWVSDFDSSKPPRIVVDESTQVKESRVEEGKGEESKVGALEELRTIDPVIVQNASDLTESLCTYFGVKTIVTSKLYNSVCDFISCVTNRNQLVIVAHAFEKYKAYKARSQEQRHGALSWIGTKENHYQDGQWSEVDWDLKLKNIQHNASNSRTLTETSPTAGKDYSEKF